MLQATGDVLTILGLVLALGALVYESHARDIPTVSPALRRVGMRLARALRLSRRRDAVVRVGAGGGTWSLGVPFVYGRAPEPLRETDPPNIQIRALAANLEKTEKFVLAKTEYDRERLAARLDKRADDLAERLANLQRQHQEMVELEESSAGPRLRWELGGLILAVLGAALSTAGRVIA